MISEMNQTVQSIINRPLPSIATSTGISAGSSIITFAKDWGPIVELTGGILACLSALVGLAIGLYHLKEIWKKEKAKKKPV